MINLISDLIGLNVIVSTRSQAHKRLEHYAMAFEAVPCFWLFCFFYMDSPSHTLLHYSPLQKFVSSHPQTFEQYIRSSLKGCFQKNAFFAHFHIASLFTQVHGYRLMVFFSAYFHIVSLSFPQFQSYRLC